MLFLLPVAIPAINLPAGIHPVGHLPARPSASGQAGKRCLAAQADLPFPAVRILAYAPPFTKNHLPALPSNSSTAKRKTPTHLASHGIFLGSVLI